MIAPSDCPICCPAGWSPNVDQVPDEDCPTHGRERSPVEVQGDPAMTRSPPRSGPMIPRVLRRQTTANPRAAVCWLCPSWFYGLTPKRARTKLNAHVTMTHPRHGCGAA